MEFKGQDESLSELDRIALQIGKKVHGGVRRARGYPHKPKKKQAIKTKEI